MKVCTVCIQGKPVKRFQMKSNGCRDVRHTGLQCTQTRRTTGKQKLIRCLKIYVTNTTIEKNDWLLECSAATDVGSLGRWQHLAYQWSFLFVCIVGLYAGHPYIHLISFEIFLLACPVYILYKPSWITFPSAINVQFPHIVFGTELNTLACGISSPLVGSSCSPGTEPSF